MLMERLSGDAALTPAERQIADVVLGYPQYVIGLSLRELAERAYVSEASVIRFAQKLGCKGFADFKVHLAQELDSFTGDRPAVPVDVPVGAGDGPHDVCATMYDLALQALKDAREGLDVNLVTRAARLMGGSDLVHVYGRGESLVLAEDFHYKLIRVGIRSTLNAESGFQEATSLAGGRRRRIRECALVISHYCDSAHLNSVTDELRAAKIPYVLLTAAANPWPYDLAAYVTLRYPSAESRHKMGPIASRTSALYVLDCLFATLFTLDFERNVSDLTQSALRKERRHYFYRQGSPVPGCPPAADGDVPSAGGIGSHT